MKIDNQEHAIDKCEACHEDEQKYEYEFHYRGHTLKLNVCEKCGFELMDEGLRRCRSLTPLVETPKVKVKTK